MPKKAIKGTIGYSISQNCKIQDSISETIKKPGIIISSAKTAKEICSAPNYNCSVELFLSGPGLHASSNFSHAKGIISGVENVKFKNKFRKPTK